MTTSLRYHCAFSFAGEDRVFAESVAEKLLPNGVMVFVDSLYKPQLWGADLTVELPKHYTSSRFAVMFISEHYTGKMWTYYEKLILLEKHYQLTGQEYLLPVFLNGYNQPLPGLNNLVGQLHICTNEKGRDELVEALMQKISPYLHP